jgi:hypothetical protein
LQRRSRMLCKPKVSDNRRCCHVSTSIATTKKYQAYRVLFLIRLVDAQRD